MGYGFQFVTADHKTRVGREFYMSYNWNWVADIKNYWDVYKHCLDKSASEISKNCTEAMKLLEKNFKAKAEIPKADSGWEKHPWLADKKELPPVPDCWTTHPDVLMVILVDLKALADSVPSDAVLREPCVTNYKMPEETKAATSYYRHSVRGTMEVRTAADAMAVAEDLKASNDPRANAWVELALKLFHES